MGPFSSGPRARRLLALFALALLAGLASAGTRARRETRGKENLLTVEWEGIQIGDYPEDLVRGFLVEYRDNKDLHWNVHSGVIPYKGPNYQYRVQIPNLPTGVTYKVKIKVLGENNQVIVETNEIEARNEIVSIRCEFDELTEARNVRLMQTGQYSLAIGWESPECGSVGEYQVELSGVDVPFDIHRQTVAQPTVSVTNLLPGTEYQVRVRAVDRSRNLGPWNSHKLVAKTQGEAPKISTDISLVYRTDSELRVYWDPFDDERLQHYEVMAVEVSDEGRRVERARVGPDVNSHLFAGLLPSTKYIMGVVAFVDHEPRILYQLSAKTSADAGQPWKEKPTVVQEGSGHFTVHWKLPSTERDVSSFIVEYRLPNETAWRSYGDDIVILDPEQTDYSLNIDNIAEGAFFTIRIFAVDEQDRVIARTGEFTVGSAAAQSCAGDAGIPKDVRAEFVSSNSIQFAWSAPECDETYGPIDGYEYMIWNTEKASQPDAASYTGGTSVTVSKLDAGARYSFRVRSRSGNAHSGWSDALQAFTRSASERDDQNIYKVRVVLSPPDSFLVWTPLPEDANRIQKFRVSYKKSDSTEWVRVEDSPARFQCPAGVSSGFDFCHDLSALANGVQYTADVNYELTNGEWTSHGSPLFFILVEKAEDSAPATPNNLGITSPDASSLEIKWLPPLSSVHIASYQLILEDVNTGASSTADVPGSTFSHTFSDLSPHGSYRISVRGLADSGKPGPFSTKMFTFSRTAQPVEGPKLPSGKLGIQQPRIEQHGARTLVYWTTEGDVSPDVIFMVEVRRANDRHWQMNGRYVTGSGHRQYRQELENLESSTPYFVQIKAIDRNRNVLATSQATSFTTQCEAPSAAPSNVRLEQTAPGVVTLRWTAPQNDLACAPFFVIEGQQDGLPVNVQVDGRQRSHTFPDASGSAWSLRIRSANLGGTGPSSESVTMQNLNNVRVRRSVCDPRTDFWCRSAEFAIGRTQSDSVLVSLPQVQPRGDGLHVAWRSEGNGRGVFGYRIQFRKEGREWVPYGQIVPYVGDNQDYAQTLTGLEMGSDYQIHVQVLDRNSYVMYTSPETSAQIACTAPSHPPSQLKLEAPDAKHVRASWSTPAQSTWGCSAIHLELHIDEPRGQQPVRLDGRQTSHVFVAEANQPWSVRIRAVNSAGHSAWSSSVSARTPPTGELLVGPHVNYRQGVPLVSWTSAANAEGVVRTFQLEWRSQTDTEWRKHRNELPYSGWQRPYSVDLSDLPAGHNYQVRVLATDATQGVVYTSPSVNVQTQQRCSPPRRAPSGLQVSTLGPTQIRLTWQSLHETEWNCDQLWYVVKYSTAKEQGFKNLTHGENQVVFESEPFTQWHFEVQAANPSGVSAWSRAESAQTQQSAPGPISDLRVYPTSGDAVQLSWRPPVNPNGQITGYEITYQLISRGMCESTPDRPITVSSDRTGFTLQGLYPHSKYRIGVAAKTSIAGERVSEEVQTEQAPPSAAPIYLRVDAARPSDADVSWQAPPCLQTNGEVTEYEYELASEDRWANVPPKTERIRSNRARIGELQAGARYRLKVRAYTTKGAGPWSAEVPLHTAPAQVVSPPPYVGVVNTGKDNAHVVWQTPPNGNYYDRYRCRYNVAGQAQHQEKQFPAHSPCAQEVLRRQQLPPQVPRQQLHCGRIDNLKPEETYDFSVSACRREGDCSDWSRPEQAKISEGPVQVLSVHRIAGSATSLTVGWSVSGGDTQRVTGYRITVVPRDNSQRPQTFTVDATTLQYRVDRLKTNTVYTVTVEAATGAQFHPGTSVQMQTDSAPLVGVQYAPRVVEERASSVTVEWNAESYDCAGFIMEYRLEAGTWQPFDRRVACSPGSRTYRGTIENLPTNSAVDIRIRVVSQQNEQSNPSPEVRARTKCTAPLSPPQALRVDAPSPNEVRVSWARPAKSLWQCDQLNVEIGYRVGSGLEKVVPVPGEQTDYTFPAEPNSRWTIRVRASNQVGASPWSAEQSITTRQGAPGTVRDLRLTTLSPNEVHVQWMPPLVQRGTIVGYDISYRLKHRLACPDEEPQDLSREYVTVYNHKDLDYKLTGLLPYSLYEVKVRARTTELGPEETKEVSTWQQPPSSTPLNLQLIYALERSLAFQWEPVDCSQRHGKITNYEYEIIGQDHWAKLERQIANTSDAKVTIDGLTPFTKYIMRVKAYNSIGGGPNTENLDVMTAKADAPLPPQDLVVNHQGTDFFNVSWLPPYPPYGPHDAYKIRYQLFDAQDWEVHEVPVKDPRLDCQADSPRFCFGVDGLEQGRQYRVQVACRIEGGNYGPWSTVTVANTLQILPDAPRAIELIEKTDHSLHIRWIPPHDPQGVITQYRITYQSLDDPHSRPQVVMVDHPRLDHLIDHLTPETTYNISIATGTATRFGPSISTRYTTDPFHIPTVLQAPTVTPDGANALNVEWLGVLDPKNRVRGYIIEIRPADNPVWIEYGDVVIHEGARRHYVAKVSGLDPDTLYMVRIKVVDQKQRISDASPEAQGRTGCAAPLAPPSNVNVNAPNSKQIRLGWQPPFQGSWRCSKIWFRVEFHNGTGPHQVQVPSGTVERVFDSGPNTAWRFRVRTENDAGVSAWSNDLSIKTAEGAPGPVKNLDAKPLGPTRIRVYWETPDEPNGHITGYTVTYKLKSIGECGDRSSTPTTVHVQDPNAVLEGLLPDATYEIHVVAHTSQAGPQSKTVTATTEEAPPTGAPQQIRVSSVTSARADVSWKEIDCERRNGKITGYTYELVAESAWAENRTATVSSHRVSLDRLTPFTQYRIRVKGVNSRGEGPFGDFVDFLTLPDAPTPPTDLVEEQSFPHAIEISFRPPTPPNGILDSYKIRYTPEGQLNFKEVRVSAEDLECSDVAKRAERLCYRLGNLEPEQEYEIQVAAHTERGQWSDWSERLVAKTQQQNIPVLERELEVDAVRSTSITVKWEGLEPEQAKHVVGYILEYKGEEEHDRWQEYNGVVRHRSRHNEYKVTVRDLEESTEYFFRLRVVGKNDKRGSPGPELKAITLCGRPEEPPRNVHLESVDFETVRLTWERPEDETFKCDSVVFVVDWQNTTGRGTIEIDQDDPSELVLPTVPGTKWDVRMRTETREDGEKPHTSRWSDRVKLTTKSLPGELFVQVDVLGPDQAKIIWELADPDQKWDYGVDVTYQLKKLGGCQESASGQHEPITKYNVQEHEIILDDLKPGSEYEVSVTPRKPPNLQTSIETPKTVRKFKTDAAVPTGTPTNLRVDVRKDQELGFKWDPPACVDQNGAITQYEFELVGVEEWNEGTREGVTPRTSTLIDQLQPGSLYRMRVKAYTSAGAGPWSEPLEVRTTGTELGPPRELTAVQTKATQIQLTWLPPYPERAPITAYKIRYSPRADDSNPEYIELSGDALSCHGYKSHIITSDNLCATVPGLQPSTTYRFAVQAQSSSGKWGEWSPDYFSTTRKDDNELLGGSLRLLSAGHDNLKVQWSPPAVIGDKIDKYLLNISVASVLDQNPKGFTTSGRARDYHFRGLKPVTQYNVTLEGTVDGKRIWLISNVFATTDFTAGLLSWLPAPTDLHLIEKSDTMLHVDWQPPEIYIPEHRDLITHYRVTIAPFDELSRDLGPAKTYTVPVPGNSIKFTDLTPETIYNITVQAGTASGYGETLWGTYSTLAHGERHVLRLKNRTPTTLHVEWDPVWGMGHNGYILTARAIDSVFKHVPLGRTKTFSVEAHETAFVIQNLSPSTTYNVTLVPRGMNDLASGVYSTLPPGWFLVKNLKHCDKTQYATSMSWEPVELNMASHYQVRYLRLNDNNARWINESERRREDLLCPKDPCNRLCYLVFNMEHPPEQYVFQVRAMVDGQWNRWRTAGKGPTNDPEEVKENCCIVPPPYMVQNIGVMGTWWEVDVNPADTEQNITRYYVVVDEREPAGDTNWTYLTDKVTAHRRNIPYYVAASFSTETLKHPTKVRLGDGTVIGGYLNYPLEKGKKYNYEIYTLWRLNEAPVVARLRGGWPGRAGLLKASGRGAEVQPFLAASGWPWWWLLLLLLLLLLSILLCCALLWCLKGKRRRSEILRGIHTANLQSDREGLLDAEKGRVNGYGDRKLRGDFEDGYSKGYHDASKSRSADDARRRMDEYDRSEEFRKGFAAAMRDAGMHGLSTSMHNLAQRGQKTAGYSAGYMQGFRDGTSGAYGNSISTSLLRTIEERYPDDDLFRQGYLDGFKEGAGSGEKRTFEDSRRLQQSLSELTERLTSLEKQTIKEKVIGGGGGGDEITHSTKIYHVYNQQPEGMGYNAQSVQQLAHELDEMNSTSRRSTLRRHYTPGDYLKYDTEGGYSTLRGSRRSLSASALGRESATEHRSRLYSGTGASYISRGSGLDRAGATDTFSRRYNYRSRSDVGSPRRYASQTLLDGVRPGPTTPHVRRDALSTLQRELDTLSRSPRAAGAVGGYSSDTGYLNDTIRSSRVRGYSNYDYDTIQQSATRSETKHSASTAQGAVGVVASSPRPPTTSASATSPVDSATKKDLDTTHTTQSSSHQWPENLMDIVNEPKPATLDRYERYSSSLANLRGGADDGLKETVEERYQRSYREEHSSGAGGSAQPPSGPR
ncbi:hypothetical protein QR680_013533 [Steinernema hermaphroditum]|uniref:Fibronectin type-III domain-containing protein n=1 Tax=Steinernema hermaphroditum TaxID=289476 RepID=A0AA39I5U5_9BILA|nr:hypothetical protein QR680_013533 [Steinernema hermaphroditum]